jgi:hypothetical protein
MILNEEFLKVYEELNRINEWVDTKGNKVNVTAPTSSSNSSSSTSATSTAGNLYVVFNYYRPDDLDNFCILLAETDRTTTINALIEMAEQSVENFGRYKNTLVCHKIDPDDYGMTEAEFNDAAESKHDYCGEGLHHEFTDVVYVLSHLAANKKPLYTIDRNIVEIEFYDEFLGQKINNTGITFDDIYDSNYSSNLIDKVYNDPAFQKFMKDKLTKTITNAL